MVVEKGPRAGGLGECGMASSCKRQLPLIGGLHLRTWRWVGLTTVWCHSSDNLYEGRTVDDTIAG